MHVELSKVVAPVQAADKVACVSQALHGVQLVPVPKNPALQLQLEGSNEVDPLQGAITLALVSQIWHGEQ